MSPSWKIHFVPYNARSGFMYTDIFREAFITKPVWVLLAEPYLACSFQVRLLNNRGMMHQYNLHEVLTFIFEILIIVLFQLHNFYNLFKLICKNSENLKHVGILVNSKTGLMKNKIESVFKDAYTSQGLQWNDSISVAVFQSSNLHDRSLT